MALAQAMCSDSGLLRSELGSVFNPTKLATVDAYVLSSSVEEIEKIMVRALVPPRVVVPTCRSVVIVKLRLP